MVFLLLFTLVAVGRIQEVLPALAPLRIGLVTGGLALLAWVIAPGSLWDKIPLEIKQARYVLILLGLGIVTVPLSVWPRRSFEFVTEKYWKTILLFLLVIFWSRSLQDMRRLVWVCCLGMAGLVILGLLTGEMGGARFNAESETYDANDLAMLLVMVLPLVLYLFSTSGVILRIALLGMASACLYGVVLTRSRGGLLALLVVGALILWQSALSRTTKVLVTGIALLVFGGLAGSDYWERMEAIWDPKTELERTGTGRTEVWKTGLVLMATHPWGVGINGFEIAEGLSHGGEGRWKAAHNSFLQVGVDLGVAGLAVFLMMFALTIKELRRIRGVVPATTEHSRLKNVISLAAALEISLWGFIVGGFFLSQAYSGLLYIVFALSVACIRLAMPCRTTEEQRSGGIVYGHTGSS